MDLPGLERDLRLQITHPSRGHLASILPEAIWARASAQFMA